MGRASCNLLHLKVASSKEEDAIISILLQSYQCHGGRSSAPWSCQSVTSASANFRRLVISTVFFGCQCNMQISGSWKERNTFFLPECIFHRHRGRCEVEVPTGRGEITQLNEKRFSLWVLNEPLRTERNKRLNRPAVGGFRTSQGNFIYRFSRQVSTCWFNLLDKSTVRTRKNLNSNEAGISIE